MSAHKLNAEPALIWLLLLALAVLSLQAVPWSSRGSAENWPTTRCARIVIRCRTCSKNTFTSRAKAAAGGRGVGGGGCGCN
jgi:hypothetical protein